MELVPWLLLALVGLIAGGYGVTVGAGGGFLIAPVLLLFYHVPPAQAAGTSLAIVLANSLSGTTVYVRQRRVDYRTGLLLALAAIPGSLLGAGATRMVSAVVFRALFGVVLLILAAYLGIRPEPLPRPQADDPLPKERRRTVTDAAGNTFHYAKPGFSRAVFGLGLGFISSFFGVGAGWLVVPMLVHLYRIPTHLATATSIFSLAVYSTVGVMAHLRLGNILWAEWLVAGAGVVVGAQVGAHLSRSVKGPLLVRLLAVPLGVVGVQLLL